MEVWLASDNVGKLEEIKMLLKPLSNLPGGAPQVHLQKEIPGFSTRPETGKTFLENAQIKARTLAAVKKQVWVLGEDSGLSVAGLGDLPGIHSARYAGEKASATENYTKLLKMMSLRNVQDRSAKFICSLVVITPSGEEWSFQGEWNGSIAKVPKGQHGFGYDPVFIPANSTQANASPASDGQKTIAELGPGYKQMHSHRSLAVRAWLEKMAQSGS